MALDPCAAGAACDTAILATWANFYVIVGSSAGALTGLMFVVITLVAGIERLRATPDAVNAFSTPTIVHFCVALVVAACVCTPWHRLEHAAGALAIIGLYGGVYVARTIIKAARQTAYRPERDDWIWYMILPFLAYVIMLGSACALLWDAGAALFALAGAVVFLVLIGIHNAWDSVTYIALGQYNHSSESSGRAE